MFDWKKPEVLVVGAGPVGMVAALVLAQHGVRVQIVDREWRPGAHSYALALHIETLSLLEELGVLGDVLEHAYKVRTIAVHESHQRRAEMRLPELGDKFPYIAVLQQSLLETLLERALSHHGVKVLWNHELAQMHDEGDHVEVAIDHLEKESMGYPIAHTEWVVARSRVTKVPFVIGADGHTSDVRRALDIEQQTTGNTRYFAVFEFRTQADFHAEMHLAVEGGTINVLWPLPDGHCRWSFEIDAFDTSWDTREKDRFILQANDGSPLLHEENLRRLISERAPWFTAEIGDITWRSVVKFESRMATSFGRNRVWLAGDAAHQTGPAGVQSMNVGMREAHQLATSLAGILRADTPSDVLENYNQERISEWTTLLGQGDDLVYEPGAPAWVRGLGQKLIPAIPASGENLARLARQVGVASLEPEATES